MKLRFLCGLLAVCVINGIGGTTWSQAPEQVRQQANQFKPRLTLSMLDLKGTSHELGQNDLGRVRVFVFLSTECPIANGYTPTLNDLHARVGGAGDAGVDLFGVISDATVTREAAAKHFEEFQVSFPVLFDASGLLADELKPTHVPEAFVFDRHARLAYRGAIDNAWEGLGRRRPKAESHFLSDAIQAAMKNKPLAVARTEPIGCHFEKLPVSDVAAKVTYCRDVAPVVQSRCMNCHRPGQVAPFSLMNYDEVAKHAAQIVEVTQKRIMPPWMPERSLVEHVSNVLGEDSKGHVENVPHDQQSRFVGERWLTDRELAIFKTWAETGRAKGNEADLPPAPVFAEGWQLGEPDLVVKMREPFTVRAGGADLLQNFVIPIDIAEDKLVAAIEFHPGNKRVVHHAVLFLDDKGQARKLDAATPEPGYSNFGGPGFLPSGALGGWSVGNTARRLPNEMGRYLKKGSDLVVQVHYHPTGKVEVDQSEIGIYFVKRPVAELLKQPAKLVGSIWMANYEMDIPAGEKNYRRSTSYVLPRDVILVGVVPHMHLLGRSMKVTAMLPDPRSRSRTRESSAGNFTTDATSPAPQTTLISIPNWNYNWQDEYYFERPMKLSAGTRLEVEAAFDNSSGNPSNPSSPPRRVTWGDETTDEMLFCFFLLTADKTEDLIHTIFDNLGHDLKQPRRTVVK